MYYDTRLNITRPSPTSSDHVEVLPWAKRVFRPRFLEAPQTMLRRCMFIAPGSRHGTPKPGKTQRCRYERIPECPSVLRKICDPEGAVHIDDVTWEAGMQPPPKLTGTHHTTGFVVTSDGTVFSGLCPGINVFASYDSAGNLLDRDEQPEFKVKHPEGGVWRHTAGSVIDWGNWTRIDEQKPPEFEIKHPEGGVWRHINGNVIDYGKGTHTCLLSGDAFQVRVSPSILMRDDLWTRIDGGPDHRTSADMRTAAPAFDMDEYFYGPKGVHARREKAMAMEYLTTGQGETSGFQIRDSEQDKLAAMRGELNRRAQEIQRAALEECARGGVSQEDAVRTTVSDIVKRSKARRAAEESNAGAMTPEEIEDLWKA